MNNTNYWQQIDLEKSSVNVPQDLSPIFNLAKNIYRYKMDGYVDGVILDNDAQHVYRTAVFGSKISKTLERMMFIHDLPEVVLISSRGGKSDTTVIEKLLNQKLGEQIESDEDSVAKKIFKAEDLVSYERFVNAKRNMKLPPTTKVDGLGILAKIIDTTDGNMCFHYYVSQWHRDSNNPRMKNTWSTAGLEYTFNYYKQTRELLNNLNFDDSRYKDESIKRLNDHLRFVMSCWASVPKVNMPETVRAWMDSIEVV